MKKICSVLILLSVFILTLSGCGGSIAKQQAVKDTPHQVGVRGQISSSVIGFDFDKSYEEADIVAEVKICEWLGERNNEDEFEKTIFRTSLEKTFKNTVDSELKEIKLFQTGNSYFTIKDCPLFKNNDRLILYLKKADKEDNTYWILGGHTGVFRIVNTDGQDYIVKQVGDCPELSEAIETENSFKVRNTLTQNYSLEFSNVNGIPQIYNLEAIEQLIEKQKNK